MHAYIFLNSSFKKKTTHSDNNKRLTVEMELKALEGSPTLSLEICLGIVCLVFYDVIQKLMSICDLHVSGERWSIFQNKCFDPWKGFNVSL